MQFDVAVSIVVFAAPDHDLNCKEREDGGRNGCF